MKLGRHARGPALLLAAAMAMSCAASLCPAQAPLPEFVPLPAVDAAATSPTAPPQELQPWWIGPLTEPLQTDAGTLQINLDEVVLGTLMYSPRVKVAAEEPIVRRLDVPQAQARFDPRTFLETKFTDTSDPVGNLLTTGGARRFIDQNANTTAGVRKVAVNGGRWEASQRFGYEHSNSDFFTPQNQGTTRLMLTWTQPLLHGAGKVYNTSLICVAEQQTAEAEAHLASELQSILVELHRAYWDVRLQRAALLQRRRLQDEAIKVCEELRARADYDVVGSQLVRAEAAAAQREAAVIRFSASLANAETRLRTMIGDPHLINGPRELIPVTLPDADGQTPEPDLVAALHSALQYRPEIQQVLAEIRVAAIRAQAARNELLPVLDLVVGTYASGLQGNTALGDSWVDQFSTGRPTYWTGLQYEFPLFNRAATAKQAQQLVELRRATQLLARTLNDIRCEVEIVAREVTTSRREMLSNRRAMAAESTEIDYLTSRWRLFPGDQATAGTVLDDVLKAQERLADAEFAYSASEAAHQVSKVHLLRVTGSLLCAERVEICNAVVEGLPMLDVRSMPPVGASTIDSALHQAIPTPLPVQP